MRDQFPRHEIEGILLQVVTDDRSHPQADALREAFGALDG